jgi:hypothetical protein
MEVRPKVNVRVFDDTAAKEVLFGPSDAAAERSLGSYREFSAGKLEKAADATYFDLPLGAVAAVKGFILKSDKDLDVKLNGGSQVIQLRLPLRTGTVAEPTPSDFLVLYMDAVITQIQVDAPTDPALVTFCLWGDPPAS